MSQKIELFGIQCVHCVCLCGGSVWGGVCLRTSTPESSSSESCSPSAAFCSFFLSLASWASVSSNLKPFPRKPLELFTVLPSWSKAQIYVITGKCIAASWNYQTLGKWYIFKIAIFTSSLSSMLSNLYFHIIYSVQCNVIQFSSINYEW